MLTTCKECKELTKNRLFTTREEMAPIIALLKELALSSKINIQEVDEEYQNTEEELSEIGSTPPYPDIIFYKFACSKCGNKYRLFLDWYHGKGELIQL